MASTTTIRTKHPQAQPLSLSVTRTGQDTVLQRRARSLPGTQTLVVLSQRPQTMHLAGRGATHQVKPARQLLQTALNTVELTVKFNTLTVTVQHDNWQVSP
jgi:hypothetical protein